MDCETPLGCFTATAGVNAIRFDLSHGLCERCKSIRLAELESIRLARAVADGLNAERERESRALRFATETGDTGKRLSQLLKECGI